MIKEQSLKNDLTKVFKKISLFFLTVSITFSTILIPTYAKDTTYENKVTVSVVNFSAKWGDKKDNLSRIKKYIIKAADSGSDIILFPEMALTGYGDQSDVDKKNKMQTLNAETSTGPSAQAIADICKEKGVYVVYGYPERDTTDSSIVYNSAEVIGPNGIIGSYQKIHPVGGEPNWCARGTTPFVFDTKWGPIGVSICMDTYSYPELTRYLSAENCRLILNPTATSRGFNGETGDSTKWQWYFLARINGLVDTDGLFVASANLTGNDIDENNKVLSSFPGGSCVIGPDTKSATSYTKQYIGSTKNQTEKISTGTIDLSLSTLSNTSTNLFQPELYSKWYSELAKERTEEKTASAS